MYSGYSLAIRSNFIEIVPLRSLTRGVFSVYSYVEA